MGELEGRVAIVTGAGSGIGRATTLLYAQNGATVIAADLNDGVDETAKLGGDNVHAVRCDAGDEASVEKLVSDTVSAHGKLDIFYANAGISGGFDGLFDQNADDWAIVSTVLSQMPDNDAVLTADLRRLGAIKTARAETADAFFCASRE